ncbi:hypothetical protein RP20_CCG018807 [Aedes albopictus]|nr:hypothetical protein RP20_CCG018807 [Aedes albopictus]
MPGMLEKSAAEADKHLSDITAIVCFQDHVFTSGGDGKVKIWTKELTLSKEIAVHDGWIYAMAADSRGRIYTSSSDGTIRCLPNPLQSDEVKELLKCGDDIESLFVDTKDNLYSGDDKGIVTMWVDHRMKFKFNLVEEVRSLVIQNNIIYSIRENDLTVTEVLEGSANGRYMTKASIPGRCPVTLCGSCTNGVSSNAAIVTRDGHGIVFIKNNAKEQYRVLWTKEYLTKRKPSEYAFSVIRPFAANGRYMTKASIPGRCPVTLCGSCTNGVSSNAAIVTRDGHGIVFIKNNAKEQYRVLWTKEKAHDMIINCLLGTNDHLYSAGYDGYVKKWSCSEKEPELLAEVNLEAGCLNALQQLAADNSTVYVGGSDGILKLVKFS